MQWITNISVIIGVISSLCAGIVWLVTWYTAKLRSKNETIEHLKDVIKDLSKLKK